MNIKAMKAQRLLKTVILACICSVPGASQGRANVELLIADQFAIPPEMVRVDKVTVDSSSVIKIYRRDKDSGARKLVGSKALAAGTFEDVFIDIGEAPLDGDIFVAAVETGAKEESDRKLSDTVMEKTFSLRKPLVAPGPYLPLKPSIPLRVGPNLTNKAPFTFVCIPVDAQIDSIAVEMEVQQIAGDIEVRLIAPVPGNNRGRSISLLKSHGSQTIGEVFPITRAVSDKSMTLTDSFKGLAARGWYVIELAGLSPDAEARVTDLRLFVEPRGATPKWPDIVPHIYAYHQNMDDRNMVTIDQVISDREGWVVLYDDDGSGPRQSMYYRHVAAPGAPGNIVGYAPVVKGRNRDVAIKVSGEHKVGETFYAVLHQDTGRKGVFEFKKGGDIDVPVVDLVEPSQSTHDWFTLTSHKVEKSFKYYY